MHVPVCPLPELVNTVGLSLDIVGVILLFLFGLPPKVSRGGGVPMEWSGTPEDSRKAKRYEMISWGALAVIVLGFVLQIVSTWMA